MSNAAPSASNSVPDHSRSHDMSVSNCKRLLKSLLLVQNDTQSTLESFSFRFVSFRFVHLLLTYFLTIYTPSICSRICRVVQCFFLFFLVTVFVNFWFHALYKRQTQLADHVILMVGRQVDITYNVSLLMSVCVPRTPCTTL